jgi:hypothetical protein
MNSEAPITRTSMATEGGDEALIAVAWVGDAVGDPAAAGGRVRGGAGADVLRVRPMSVVCAQSQEAVPAG